MVEGSADSAPSERGDLEETQGLKETTSACMATFCYTRILTTGNDRVETKRVSTTFPGSHSAQGPRGRAHVSSFGRRSPFTINLLRRVPMHTRLVENKGHQLPRPDIYKYGAQTVSRCPFPINSTPTFRSPVASPAPIPQPRCLHLRIACPGSRHCRSRPPVDGASLQVPRFAVRGRDRAPSTPGFGRTLRSAKGHYGT